MRLTSTMVLTTALVVAPASPVAAATVESTLATSLKLLSSNPQDLANFGQAVGVAGDVVVVGAPDENVAGSQSGAAYVFELDGPTWTATRLIPNDPMAGDLFGFSVDTSGSRVVVGAAFEDGAGTSRGAAYVFERDGNGWVQTAKLTASDAADFDEFGFGVAIWGDRIAVGSPFDDTAGSESGSVYIYTWNGVSWVQSKIVNSTGAAGDNFGFSVDLWSDRLVTGAPFDDTPSNSGAAYVYENLGGTLAKFTLVTVDRASNDRVGWSVGISGGRIVVGAPLNDDAGESSGSAYIFERTGTTWSEVEKLTASDASVGDQFGAAVDVTAGRIVAGAPVDGHAGVVSGAAYVYDAVGNVWVERRVTAADADANHDLGSAVAVAGDRVILGSPGDDDVGPFGGSVFNVLWAFCSGFLATNSVATSGDDAVVGTAATDVLVGLAGNDVLVGLEGNDKLCGGDGADTLDGGTGSDALFGDAGNDTLIGAGGFDTLNGGLGEDFLVGGPSADTLNGDEDDDKLVGQAGADTLNGGPGDDFLFGGDDADVANGGPGDDTLVGGDGDDTLNGQAGRDDLIGGLGVDTLNGGDDADRVLGGGSGDIINGGNGADALLGGPGNDVISGAADNDVVRGGNGNDILNGNAGDDRILGEGGNDALNGGGGNDLLVGGSGNDSLDGGAGVDTGSGGPGLDVCTSIEQGPGC